MISQGPNNPGTMADDAAVGTVAWINVNDAKTQNNTDAYVTVDGGNSHYLKATDFGFSIPAGATINGVVVEIDRWELSSHILDKVVSLVVGDVVGGDNKKDGSRWDIFDTDTYVSYGGAADVWSCALTSANVNAADFGVVLQVQFDGIVGSTDANVDHIRITVYYTEPFIPAFMKTQTKYWGA